MSIFGKMRLMKRLDDLQKKNDPLYGIQERMILDEYSALCRMANSEQLRKLEKSGMSGYGKWRKKNLQASPLDFFN